MDGKFVAFHSDDEEKKKNEEENNAKGTETNETPSMNILFSEN